MARTPTQMKQVHFPHPMALTRLSGTPFRCGTYAQKIVARILSVGFLLTAQQAFALALGEAHTNSRVGEPLHIEIPLLLNAGENPTLRCIRLLGAPPNYHDDMPWVSQGRLRLDHNAQGTVLIVDATASRQPALMLGLGTECGQATRRDYALLLNPPMAETPSVAAKAGTGHDYAAAQNSSTNNSIQGTIAPGGNLVSGEIPRSVPAPGSRTAARATEDQNRPSSSGTAADRLHGETLREADVPVAQADQDVSTVADAPPGEQSASESHPVAPADTSPTDQAPAPLPTLPKLHSDVLPWYANNVFIFSLTGLACLILLAFVLRRYLQRKNQHMILPTVQPSQPCRPAEVKSKLPEPLIDAPLTEKDIWPDAQPVAVPPGMQPKRGALPPVERFTVSRLGPLSKIKIINEDMEEHDSAVELADIMMSFGRVQGAAQALADYIRSNPKQAVKPWVKLLEVYKAANMRSEFEALCKRLNKTFNVKPIQWDEFEVARRSPASLEDMPHIVQKLQESWGSRKAQSFLHELLRDNRQGTRQGFPLAIVDDILMLLSVLESQVGPYRPGPEDATAGPTQTGGSQQRAAPLNFPPLMLEDPIQRPAIAATSEARRKPAPQQPSPQRKTPPIQSHELDLILDAGMTEVDHKINPEEPADNKKSSGKAPPN